MRANGWIAIGQQDVVPTRGSGLEVSVRWTGEEAQSYKQGGFIPWVSKSPTAHSF